MKSGVFIIAEAGVNHNGKVELAEQMIWEAQKAGADAVKFQTYITDRVISKNAPKAEYQKRETGCGETQREMVRKLELSYDDFRYLKSRADQMGIPFLSTPFDLESINFLDSLGLAFWKIPSGEVTNLPYLERIAATKKPIVLSTGMCEMREIEAALLPFLKAGYEKDMITLLHCTTEYPAPYDEVNLKAMLFLKEQFQTRVGYSDHTLGIEVPIAAVAMGAEVLEKHFTLDKELDGPDHRASLNPAELKSMVTAVRKVERCLGDGKKSPSQTELSNRIAARKSIVAKERILKGDILTEENITVKRPGNGISPMKWYELLGTCAKRNFNEDELIE